jgi:hypothetical protein
MSRLAPFTKRSWGLIVLAVGLFFALWVAPARAENVQLAYRQVPTCQGNSCITPIAPGSGKDMPSKWTWFAVDPARLQRMPVGWNLVIDNVRFTAIEIRVVHEGGVAVIRRGQFQLSRNWTMGNNLRFQIPVAGPDVTAIQIGYRNMDGPGLLRTIKAMDAAGHESHVLRWTVQVALVLGMLFSAFVYNMFLLTWLRTGFQRWYVVWLAGSLGYLLVWSGAILNIFPFLAGPAAVRTFYLLLGLMVGLILLMPARLLLPAPPLAAASVEGTVWRTRLTDAALGGAPWLGVVTFGEQGVMSQGPVQHGNLMISSIVFGR